MTIKELIEKLNRYPEHTEVVCYDVDAEEVVDVTGFLYSEDDETLEICTDDIQE